MFAQDPLFVEYDKSRFDAYKNADLLTGDYSAFLENSLKRTTDSTEHDFEKFANPIGMVVSGPSSNIAGRYRAYLEGDDTFLPADKIKYGTIVQGFKPVKTPSTKDLATGWAAEATGDLLYPW